MGYIKEMRKKWAKRLGMALAAVCFAILFAMTPAGEVLAETEGTVTASSANIRSSADTGSKAVASVLKGAKLSIIEETTGTDGKVWYKVWVDANTTGYIRSDLVSKTGSSSSGSSSSGSSSSGSTTSGSGTTLNTNVTVSTDGVEQVQPVSSSVTKDQVRVRADSSTSSSIVTTVKRDVVLTVSGTKAGSSGETWYLVSFMVDGTNVTGYIRSDYVTLNGELMPPADTPADTPTDPDTPADTTPDEPVTEYKDYDTVLENGVWRLVDNNAGNSYPITALIEGSEKNANALEKAQKKLSGQTAVIVILAILLVVLALGLTLLIFKLRDLMEEDGLDIKSLFGIQSSSYGPGRNVRSAGSATRRPVPRPSSGTGTRPAGSRPAGERPASQRPAGERPTGQRPVSGSAGTRPAGSRPVSGQPGERPAGQRPAAQRPAGERPVAQRPAGERPVAQRPAGERPVAQRPAGERPVGERPTAARPVSDSTGAKPAGTRPAPKNFMTDDDEFEFEFLNWDGEEDN